MNLSAKEKYSYGVGALGKDLVYALVSTYLMFYFTDVISLSPIFIGNLFLVARLWDAVNDTAMGMIVDNTRTKYGKFRPWILIGTILNAIMLVFLFKKPNLDGTAICVYFAIVYILWGMTYTIMDIPYWSMIPSLSNSKEERDKIAVIPRIFASIGWFIIGTFGLTMVKMFGENDYVKGFELFGIAIATVFIVCSLITCINVKERTDVTKKAEKVTVKQTINIIKNNDQLIAFIGSILVFNVLMQLAGGMALYYFKYVAGNEGLFPIFTACAGFAEVGGLFLFPILTRKIGRPNVFKIACYLPVVGFVLLLVAGFIAPQSVIFVALSAIFIKLGSGLSLGCATVMLADVVDYGEYKLGTRNESIIFSVQTLLVKTASAVSGWLIGIGLSSIGYVANSVQDSSTILGMRILTIIIPGALCFLCHILYKKYYKLNGKFQDEMIEGLEMRRVSLEEA